jgi:hypothetical protein
MIRSMLRMMVQLQITDPVRCASLGTSESRSGCLRLLLGENQRLQGKI